MDATKEVIADAVRQYQMTESEDWARAFHGCELGSIDAQPVNFQIHDVLFEGTAQLVVRRTNKTEDVITAQVYGRSDGRRAVIDRFVFAAQ